MADIMNVAGSVVTATPDSLVVVSFENTSYQA